MPEREGDSAEQASAANGEGASQEEGDSPSVLGTAAKGAAAGAALGAVAGAAQHIAGVRRDEQGDDKDENSRRSGDDE
jgi:hypothetical protein